MDNPERPIARSMALPSAVVWLDGAAPVDCAAVGAVLLADVPPEVEGAGVGLPVSPAGTDITPVSDGRLVSWTLLLVMMLGKPMVVEPIHVRGGA